MKKLFYFIYSVFFHIGRLMPLKKNLVALVSPHNANLNDSLGEIKTELEKRGGFEFLVISGSSIRGGKSPAKILSFFIAEPVKLARAKYIFLNDNFMPMASLSFHKEAFIVQLWHGEGALKKICLDLDLPEDIVRLEKKLYSKYDIVAVSSQGIVPLWANAFGKDETSVVPLGSARTDAFFREFDYETERRRFDELYPECRGKKLLLYAPTFRDDPEDDEKIPVHFNAGEFNARFGAEYALLAKLHPQVHKSGFDGEAVDVTGYADTIKLLRLADVLVTDYSSVFMDYILLDKPCIFYPYDLEKYVEKRPLYGRYEDIVPGRVCRDFTALLDAVEVPEIDREKYAAFKAFHLGACDGRSAKRTVDYVLKM